MRLSEHAIRLGWSLGVFCACMLVPLQAWAQEEDFGERKITIEQMPEAPRATILKAVGDGRLSIGPIFSTSSTARVMPFSSTT